MNETYDKLIDIIAVDIKLAIELIKGQDIDVGKFVDYLIKHYRLEQLKINTIKSYVIGEAVYSNMDDSGISLLNDYHNPKRNCHSKEHFMRLLITYLNYIKYE